MEWEQLNETRFLGINSSPRILPWDFPGGTVDKSLPANAGDMGLIPGPGRFHIP